MINKVNLYLRKLGVFVSHLMSCQDKMYASI